MTEVVRDVIKEVQTNKQNVYEKMSEDLKPLTEKFFLKIYLFILTNNKLNTSKK